MMADIEYIDEVDQKRIFIPKKNLGEKWIFGLQDNKANTNVVQFDQFFKAAITIATQRNDVFVVSDDEKKQKKLELNIIRKAISPRNKFNNKNEYIIFPYRIQRGAVLRYDEKTFKTRFPNVYQYLNDNREKLDNRNADRGIYWFEYGRSQAIQNMNKRKLLVSTVITHKVKVYSLSEKEIPYSGIYIIPKDNNDLNMAKEILESPQFYNYVMQIGTPASGTSMRITADDINKFKFSIDEFEGVKNE